LRAAVDAAGLKPEAAPLRVQLASGLLRASCFAEAFDACREILLDEPAHVDALELAARACRGLGNEARAIRYDAARDALEEAGALMAREADTSDEGAPITPIAPLRVVPDGDPESNVTTLADVIGMDAVKRRLQLSFLGPLKNPELRKLYGKSLRGGLLLWGPPGCGKTYLAKAIAGELGARFVAVGLEDVLDMWTGQSEKNVRTIFERARRQAPCVLFFDEVDALGQKRSNLRGSAGRNVVVQLLTELDGVDRDNDGVFVLGATNHPWDVDSALRRPGRFDRTLLVLPPDARARRAILATHLAGRPAEGVDLDALARSTDRFSGADLVHLVDAAAELALASSIDTGTARPIHQGDFTAALAELHDSTSDWLAMARNYAEFAGDQRAEYDDLLDYLRTHGGNA
jgi:SpoVK/Ycf46/Vps4 family AAA+-type ATPase